ncbi:PilW family protein [Rhodanobacter sp. TND4EL1]
MCFGIRGSWRAKRSLANSEGGFSLIELMIAMLLGLIVIGGVISVFLANQQTYRTNQALGDVQDGSRVAFEMMAQDIRSAGLTGCDSSATGTVTNVLKNSPANGGATWWANWNNALMGFGAGTVADLAPSATTPAVAGNDSLELIGATQAGLSVASHSTATTTFTLNEMSDDLKAGDATIVCNPEFSAIFQATGVDSAAKTVGYSTTTSDPGNFSNILASTGVPYTFGANALIARMTAVDWYIGATPGVAGGLSLYRVQLVNTGGKLGTTTDEMVRNVTAMKIQYLQSGKSSFVDASAITDWNAVTSVRVQLTLQSTDQNSGTDAKPIKRTFISTTTARNRVN